MSDRVLPPRIGAVKLPSVPLFASVSKLSSPIVDGALASSSVQSHLDATTASILAESSLPANSHDMESDSSSIHESDESMMSRLEFTPSSWTDMFDQEFKNPSSSSATVTSSSSISDDISTPSVSAEASTQEATASPPSSPPSSSLSSSMSSSSAIPHIPTERPILVMIHGAGHTALSFAACAQQIRELSMQSLPSSSSSPSSSPAFPPSASPLPSSSSSLPSFQPTPSAVTALPAAPRSFVSSPSSSSLFASSSFQSPLSSLSASVPSSSSFPSASSTSNQHGFPVFAFDLRGHGATQSDSEDADQAFSVESLVHDCVCLLNRVFSANHVLVLVGHSLGGALVVRVAAQTAEAQKYKPQPKAEDLSSSSSESTVVGVHASLAAVVVMDVVEGTAMNALTHMRSIISARPARFTSVEKCIEWTYRSKGVRNLFSARVSVPPQLIRDPLNPLQMWNWRTNLFATEPYWRGWFQGLSDLFLSAPCAKLLLLAGTDRLDKSLTIGQMQGKFQLVVLPAVGHTVQEDAPDKVAQTLLSFVERRTAEFMKIAALNAKLRASKAASSLAPK